VAEKQYCGYYFGQKASISGGREVSVWSLGARRDLSPRQGKQELRDDYIVKVLR